MTERLSVNINDDCAEALRHVKATRGISTTEAIRRAIALLDYFEKAEDTARLHVDNAQVCKDCGNYTDTPGHFWGCSENPTTACGASATPRPATSKPSSAAVTCSREFVVRTDDLARAEEAS